MNNNNKKNELVVLSHAVIAFAISFFLLSADSMSNMSKLH